MARISAPSRFRPTLPPWLRPALPPLAGVLIVLGEHVWRADTPRLYLTGSALALLLAACLWNTALACPWAVVAGRGGAAGNPRDSTGWSPLWPVGLFALAALAYLIRQALPATPPPESFDWGAVFSWGWVLTLTVGSVAYIFVESALWVQSESTHKEPARLRMALHGGISLGLLLILVATLNFVGSRLSLQWDLGYFHTAQPSDATLQMVEELDKPIQVGLFYPGESAVGTLLRDYFDGLEGISDQLEIGFHDAELHPKEAKRFRVRKNGTVAVALKSVVRTINVDPDLEKAREALAKFDGAFLTELAKVARSRRVAYLTVGHGERNEKGDQGLPPTTRVEGMTKMLKSKNYTVKNLGLHDGLGTEIPADASLVMVAGPTEPWQQAEIDTLRRYLDGGGKLMAFMDPAAGDGTPEAPSRLEKLLADYGAVYSSVVQANDRVFARRTQTKADHVLLATNKFMGHASVSRLRRNANQFPLLLLGTGSWAKAKPGSAPKVTEVVRGMPGTWGDANGNFVFDRGSETRAVPSLVLAIEAPSGAATAAGSGMRIMAFADADMVSDLLFGNRGNQLMFSESLAWLVGEDPAGLPSSGEDLRMQHVKGDEVVWFYLPVFGVPLLVLIAGLGAVRYRTSRGRRAAHG